MRSIDESPRAYARAGGLMYLAIILLGAFGEMFVRGSLVTHDAGTTLRNIQSAEGLWRAGIVGDLAMHVLDLPLIATFYFLLRPVDRYLAVLATLMNLVQTAVLAVNKLALVVPLVAIHTLQGAPAGTDPALLARIARMAISLHGYGFGIGLVFFGMACLVRGYLMFRSGYFPKPVGVLLQIAGLSYIVNTAALLLAPALADKLFPVILLPALVGELTCGLYLIIKGIDVPRWTERLAAERARTIR